MLPRNFWSSWKNGVLHTFPLAGTRPVAAVRAMAAAGADLVELGIPFSDPPPKGR